MHESSVDNDTNFKLLRRYLKIKIQEDNVTFRHHSRARDHIYELIKSSVVKGESHSALIIGPRGSGKTTVINSVLHQLSEEADLDNDAVIVKLSGLVHHDEKVALKSITAQMQLENAVDGKVFGTFAEQLSYLISCLTNAVERKCRSMVFLLDECHMFCGKMQTLLYNLFDVTQSGKAPMCVLGLSGELVIHSDLNPFVGKVRIELGYHFSHLCFGGISLPFVKSRSITNRIDVMDMLEKRVKSRFSHRHIFLFPNEVQDGEEYLSPVENFRRLFVGLLSLPSCGKKGKKRRKSGVLEEMETDSIQPPYKILDHCNFDSNVLLDLEPKFIEDWNDHIKKLSCKDSVLDALEKFCYYTNNEQLYRNVLFQTVSKLTSSKPYIDGNILTSVIDETVLPEHRVRQLQSLSVLELSLVIAMLHGSEILDYQPLNFEMILHRYQKFARSNSTAQSVPRPVILKAFEHLQALEIVVPARGQNESSAVQKEHILHCLAAPAVDIKTAVKSMKTLPTEIVHWLDNSIV